MRAQALLRLLQPPQALHKAPGDQADPGVEEAEPWPGERHGVGQSVEQRAQRRDVAALPIGLGHALHERRRAFRLSGGQGVADGWLGHSLALEPGARLLVQRGNLLGRGVAQSLAQRRGKERVIAIPAPLVV